MKEGVQYLIDAISLGGLYALIALGIAIIFSVMQLVNFAHGELIMIGGYVLFIAEGQSPLVAMTLAIATTIVVALLMERVAFRPARGADVSTLFITSFAVSVFLQNVAVLVMGAQPKSVRLPQIMSDYLIVGEFEFTDLDVVTILITALLLAALLAFLYRTPLGVQMRAAAEDFTMARLLGVHSNRVIAASFAISGLLAGCVAILYVGRTASLTPMMGLQPVLIGFISSVVGGLGSLSGAVVGGFALGGLSVALDALLPVDLKPARDAFLFGSVIIVLLLRPRGLLSAAWTKTRV